jgi:hypothetical protein
MYREVLKGSNLTRLQPGQEVLFLTRNGGSLALSTGD